MNVENAERRYKKILRGVVTSSKMSKTVTVMVERTVRHRRYNKYIKRQASYYAHDESNVANEGDVVDIIESRPLSKTKRWRLKDVIDQRQD